MTEGDLYEKVAFGPLALAATTLGRGVAARAAGTAARGVGSFLWQGAKSLAGMGTQGPLQGAARAGRAVGTGANAVNTAMGMGQMAKEIIRPNPPPSPNSANTQATAFKAGSLQARVEKLAFGPTNALNIASYLSMIGAEALPHDHPWHARLEALGLGGLATSTAANMISTPDEELKPGAKDLAGLGLFASALHDRTKHAGSLDDYRRALHSDSPETILAGELADAEIARKMQGALGRGSGGALGAIIGAGLGGAVQESGLLGRRLPTGVGMAAGGLLGGMAGYHAGGQIPSVRSPYEDMPREEALAKIREEIAARRTKHASHTDAAFLALAGQAGPDAARAFAHRLGSAEKDMSHLTRAGGTNKVASLPLYLAALTLGGGRGVTEAVGYAMGKSHQFTPEEAEAARNTPYNPLSVAVPGAIGYHLGRAMRAHDPDGKDLLDAVGVSPYARRFREGLGDALGGVADTLRAGSR